MLKINLMYLHGIMKLFSLTLIWYYRELQQSGYINILHFYLSVSLTKIFGMISFLFKNNEMKYNCISHICMLLFFCKLDLSSINWKLQLRLQSIIIIFHQHNTSHYVRLSHQNSSEIKERFMTSISLTNTIKILIEWKYRCC